jgi:hypothetical protein
MTDLELIFTMLGEASTTEITRQHDVHGFWPSRKAAQEKGTVAGTARKELEKRSAHKVASADSYREIPAKETRRLIDHTKNIPPGGDEK